MTMRLMRVALAAALVGGLGCSSVQAVREPGQFIPQARPNLVVVTYNDNSQVPVSGPRVSGDTLLGTWAGLGEPVVVPLNHLRRIEAVQRDKRKTTLLIVGIAAGTLAASYALSLAVKSSKHCDYSYQPPTVEPGRCISDGPGEAMP